MPDLIIKPTNTSGNKVIIQDQAGGAVLTTADSGATFSGGNIGTVTAGTFEATIGTSAVVNVAYDSINTSGTVTSSDVTTQISGTQASNTGYLAVHLARSANASAYNYTLPTGWTYNNCMLQGYFKNDSSGHFTTNSHVYITGSSPAIIIFSAGPAYAIENRVVIWKYK